MVCFIFHYLGTEIEESVPLSFGPKGNAVRRLSPRRN